MEPNKLFLYFLETHHDDEAITMKDSLRLQQPCAVWFGFKNEIKVCNTGETIEIKDLIRLKKIKNKQQS